MKKPFPRFDMARDPIRTRWYLKPITALLSFPAIIRHKTVIHRHGTEGLFFAWRRSIGRPCKPGLA